jgi:hypothetical protein
LRVTVIVSGVALVGAALVAYAGYLVLSIPFRIMLAKQRRGSRGRSRGSALPVWLNTIANMVEAGALAKMAGSGVKVQKSKRAPQVEKVPGVMGKGPTELPEDF